MNPSAQLTMCPHMPGAGRGMSASFSPRVEVGALRVLLIRGEKEDGRMGEVRMGCRPDPCSCAAAP
jgi:hypothetical protein